MTWSAFAGSGAHNWLIVAALVFLAVMTVRAIVMVERIGPSHPDALGSLDLRARGLDPVDGVLEVEGLR